MDDRPIRQLPRRVILAARQLHHAAFAIGNRVAILTGRAPLDQTLPIGGLRDPRLLRQVVAVAKRLRLLAGLRVDEVPTEAAQRRTFLRREPGGGALPERGLLLTRRFPTRILERLIPRLHRVGQQRVGFGRSSLGIGQGVPLGGGGITLVHRSRRIEVSNTDRLWLAVSRCSLRDLLHAGGRAQRLVGVHHRVDVEHAALGGLGHSGAQGGLAGFRLRKPHHFVRGRILEHRASVSLDRLALQTGLDIGLEPIAVGVVKFTTGAQLHLTQLVFYAKNPLAIQRARNQVLHHVGGLGTAGVQTLW